jgi:hypothetical protein
MRRSGIAKSGTVMYNFIPCSFQWMSRIWHRQTIASRRREFALFKSGQLFTIHYRTVFKKKYVCFEYPTPLRCLWQASASNANLRHVLYAPAHTAHTLNAAAVWSLGCACTHLRTLVAPGTPWSNVCVMNWVCDWRESFAAITNTTWLR